MDDATTNPSKKQRKIFPFSTQAIPEYLIPILNMLATMEKEEALEFLKAKRSEIFSELSSISLYLDYESQYEQIKEWIRNEFKVENIDQAISEMLTRKNSEDVSNSLGGGGSNTSSNASSTDQVKNKPQGFRLKLHTSPTGTTALPITESNPPAPARRGSKNLSRMNRPQDSGKTIDLKPKVPNQVPIAVFWNYVDQFFKNIEEGDAKFLEDPAKVFDPTPFTIPPLGRHFLDQWRDAYGYLSHSSRKGLQFSVEHVPNQFKIHSLKDRLLAMFIDHGDYDVKNELGMATEEYQTESIEQQELNNDTIISLNERIRKEMAEIGLICDNSFVKEFAEDDDICQEIHNLQDELKKQTLINNYRKQVLYQRVRKYLPAQEFLSLISELDKQIEQSYTRLSKQPTAKKRRSQKRPAAVSMETPPLSTTPLNEGEEAILRLLERRERLFDGLSGTLPSRLDCLYPAEASHSLFDLQEEARLIEEAELSGGWMQYIVDSLFEFKSSSSSIISFIPKDYNNKSHEIAIVPTHSPGIVNKD
jgi:hypothetical protein